MLKGAVGSLILAYIAIGQLKVRWYNKVYQYKLKEEYDFVIIGAGITGSVIANRLSENSNVTVLVIEAGPNVRGDAHVSIPFYARTLQGGHYDWNYKTQPLNNVYGRVIPYARGKMAGGSSSMNYLGFLRGTRKDFDNWEHLGATGWSYNDVLPYFLKIERGLDESLSDSVGRDGMLKLDRPYVSNDFKDFVIRACNEIGKRIVDYFDMDGMDEGVSTSTSSMQNGIRQSAADAYLYPALDDRENIHVTFNSTAEKVILRNVDGRPQAYGVQFENGETMVNVRARKEVILSAGAFNSPKILMLSGIGPRDHLEELGIPIKVDLAGVGKNLMDHYGSPIAFYGDQYPSNQTLSEKDILRTFPKYLSSNPTSSPLSSIFGTMLVGRFYSGTTNDSSPDIHIWFTQMEVSKTMLPKQLFAKEFRKARKERHGVLNHFSAYVAHLNSRSRGSITLASNNFKDDPIIDLRYLEDPRDLQAVIKGLRILERLEQTETFRRHNLKVVLQPFCNPDEIDKLPRSDGYYECAFKSALDTFWHAAGTCKMGIGELSVVDNRLRVHSVSGLRVADASVMPRLVSANPQATCYMIGEKGADMIKEDWEL